MRETLLSFGGAVATELTELLETNKDIVTEPISENNQNIANVNLVNTNVVNTNLVNTNVVNTNPANNLTKPLLEGSPLVKNQRKDSIDIAPANVSVPVKNVAPIAKTHPMPANAVPQPRVPANQRVPPTIHPVQPRPNSNVSFVLQPVMGGVVPPMYAPPRLAAPPLPPVYPNYYEYGPWHFYEPHGNVNLNFNMPPKNLVVNSRAGAGSVSCKNACREGETLQYAPQPNRGCWIKPTIFYDGFWTEQKVKKWVAEQAEKRFPDEQKASSPGKPDV